MSRRVAPTPVARPTYVGIGAQKCASTWLHRILAEHPQVAVPAEKEIDFFSYRYDHGFQWYERCFADAGRASLARGEISPSYFCEPSVPARIERYAPDVKILLSLRDPVQRALSNHRHEVRVGHLTGRDLSFEAGLANNPMYVEQGLYATHLKRWLRHFPREQIHVVLMEDVEAGPAGVCRTVYRFLGVDDGYVPSGLRERYNRSFLSRSRWLTRVKDSVYASTRVPGLRWAWDTAAGLGLRSIYRGINEVSSDDLIP
ncbi:MAG TPA: sulfotransferase, partial [Steroidobacteraceae bacterium]|nr:sulfotransferase [Steroidobacteraceae bacterium]